MIHCDYTINITPRSAAWDCPPHRIRAHSAAALYAAVFSCLGSTQFCTHAHTHTYSQRTSLTLSLSAVRSSSPPTTWTSLHRSMRQYSHPLRRSSRLASSTFARKEIGVLECINEITVITSLAAKTSICLFIRCEILGTNKQHHRSHPHNCHNKSATTETAQRTVACMLCMLGVYTRM